MELTALILFLLLMYSIFGAGPWSADHLLTQPRLQAPGTAGEAMV